MPDWKTWLAATPILWKGLNWLGDNPGVLLIVAAVAIALLTVWKGPMAGEDDKVDDRHPVLQLLLRLIGNAPRMALSLMAVLCLVFGVLDLTGAVPLREKRAELKIERQEEAAPSGRHAVGAPPRAAPPVTPQEHPNG